MRKVAVEAVDAIRRRLAVEVPEHEVRAEIERAYADLGRQARVRGFRPGRTPRAVLERVFGDQVRAEVFERLIRDSYREAVDAERLEPVGSPQIVTEGAAPGGPLRYSATVEVKPDVVASGYLDLEVERPLRPVDEEDVRRALEELRESFAQLVPVSDRVVTQSGDVAIADYEARVGRRLLTRADGRLIEVAAGGEGISARLAGMTVGTDTQFTITYPADHADANLAGQDVTFHVRLKALTRKELPPLDDDFAKDHGECATLAELRDRMRRHLEAAAARDAESALRGALLARLVAAHPIDVPQAMVERRAHGLTDEVIASLGLRRPPASREAELRARVHTSLEPRARDQVKAALILEAIARQERLDVPNEDVDVRIEHLAARAGQAAERVRKACAEPAARAALRAQMLQERALELVVQRARVRTVKLQLGVADPSGTR
jgi:trigger factor